MGRRPGKRGWAGQWDRHIWDLSPYRRRRRPRFRPKAAELRISLWSGLLGGLLIFNALPVQPGDATPAALVSAPGTVRVIDGDTFDQGGERIRIADIDTPELRGQCAAEIRLALAAKARLRALLDAAPFELRRLGRDEDRHGRKLRVVVRHGRSLGDVLVGEGLARTWTGRREPWC